MYYVYVLECENGSYYTGYTTDLERRYKEHVAGSPKCKYTRAFPPKDIAASWKLDTDLSMALSIEAIIKKLTKHEKKVLVTNPDILNLLICEMRI
jgi:putative endonuclease